MNRYIEQCTWKLAVTTVAASDCCEYECPMNAYLLNEINAGLKVHSEVDELPMDSFLLVLLLLKHKHVVVEKLLQPLIGVVDADLLESVVLNIKHKMTMIIAKYC